MVLRTCGKEKEAKEGWQGGGGIVGDFWGTWTGKGPMRNLRVDLLPTARLTAPYSGEGGRGAGGVMGATASPVALENVLVVLQAGVTFDAPEKWRGGVMARQRGTYSAQAITVVDFGTPATHYLATGGNVEGLRLFRASAATAAMPEGSTPVLLETGSFSARDGATRALLSGTEEDLLLLPEPTPEDAAWAMVPAEGANTVTVTPTDSTRQNPGATLPLEYTFRAMDEAFTEETLWSPTVTAVCTPTMLSDDGAIELRSASDYEWYLEACPNGATVRMTQDITLPPKNLSGPNLHHTHIRRQRAHADLPLRRDHQRNRRNDRARLLRPRGRPAPQRRNQGCHRRCWGQGVGEALCRGCPGGDRLGRHRNGLPLRGSRPPP